MEALIYIEWLSPESPDLKIFNINSSQLLIIPLFSLILMVVKYLVICMNPSQHVESAIQKLVLSCIY